MGARGVLVLLFVLAGCERKPPHAEVGQIAPVGPRSTISVTVTLDGPPAAALDQVIAQIEGQLANRDGVEDVRTIAYPDRAIAVVELTVQDPLAMMQRAVDGALVRIPSTARKTVIQRGDVTAPPEVWLALQGQAPRAQLSQELAAIAGRLRPRAGVLDVELRNAMTPAVIVRLDPARLDAYGVTIEALARAASASSSIDALAAAEVARGVQLRDLATIEHSAVGDATTAPLMLGVRLGPETTATAIRDAARAIASELPAGWTLAEVPPPPGLHHPAFTIAVRGPTWDTVAHLAANLLAVARQHPELVTRAGAPRPLDAVVDHPRADTDAAERAGIPGLQLSRATDAVFGSLGRIAGAPVVLRLADHAQIEFEDLAHFRLATTPPVAMTAFVALTREARPIVSRHGGEYEAEVFADPVGTRLPGPTAAALIELAGAPPPRYRIAPVIVAR